MEDNSKDQELRLKAVEDDNESLVRASASIAIVLGHSKTMLCVNLCRGHR